MREQRRPIDAPSRTRSLPRRAHAPEQLSRERDILLASPLDAAPGARGHRPRLRGSARVSSNARVVERVRCGTPRRCRLRRVSDAPCSRVHGSLRCCRAGWGLGVRGARRRRGGGVRGVRTYFSRSLFSLSHPQPSASFPQTRPRTVSFSLSASHTCVSARMTLSGATCSKPTHCLPRPRSLHRCTHEERICPSNRPGLAVGDADNHRHAPSPQRASYPRPWVATVFTRGSGRGWGLPRRVPCSRSRCSARCVA